MRRLSFGTIAFISWLALSAQATLTFPQTGQLTAPCIIPDYHIPHPSWWEGWLSCWPRNSELEKHCEVKTIRNRVLPLIKPQHSGTLNLGQICDIFDHFVANWIAIDDPYQEEFFANSAYSLTTMRGDCDDFAIALATSLRAIGACTRIMGAYNQKTGHAYAQVNLGATEWEEVKAYLRQRYAAQQHYTIITDEWGNHWLNLDSHFRHPGGRIYPAEKGFGFVLGHPNWCISF